SSRSRSSPMPSCRACLPRSTSTPSWCNAWRAGPPSPTSSSLLLGSSLGSKSMSSARSKSWPPGPSASWCCNAGYGSRGWPAIRPWELEVRRHLLLLRLFFGTSLSAELEYRSNFAVSMLSSALNLGASVFTVRLFFEHGTTLGGWSWPAAVIVLGAFTVLSGVSQSLLQPNLNRLVEQVREGTLDFVLLKPVDTQFWLSTRRFSPWGLPDLLLGTALIAWGAVEAQAPIFGYFALLGSMLCSSAILYSLWFAMATTTIWFVQIYNVTEVLRSLLD